MVELSQTAVRKLSKAITRKQNRPICLEGTIYFARCGEHVKIGFAADVRARLRILQAGNPQVIILAGWMRGTFEGERQLHARFEHLHVRGEWFRAADELLNFIVSVTPPGEPEAATIASDPVDGPEQW